jgi:alkylation response protein AidB-like acyl-CoA dehydrogenase
MFLDYTDDQAMLSDTVRRFVSNAYGFAARETILASGEGWSRAIWSSMADLGLFGLAFSEEDGGFGGGGVERLIVMEEIGRGLMLEPFFSSIILAGGVFRHGASAVQKQAHLPALIAGERIYTLAHSEPGGVRHGFDAETSAVAGPDGWILDGRKVAVLHAASADHLVVSARTESGLSLFLVASGAAGVSIDARIGYDNVPVGSVRLDGVAVGHDALVGELGRAAEILDPLFDEANAALVAEAVGAMNEAFDLTVEYLKTRQQFGVKIGSFQALQHRAAEMLIELELARSMAVLAAMSLDLDPVQRRRNISAAKIQIAKSGRRIAQEAVQMHGAIGVTSEYKVGHILCRLLAIDALLGDKDYHLGRIVESGGVYAELTADA